MKCALHSAWHQGIRSLLVLSFQHLHLLSEAQHVMPRDTYDHHGTEVFLGKTISSSLNSLVSFHPDPQMLALYLTNVHW